jgi:hypothetical protein
MPADDHPFDALDHQFQMEDLSVSPVAKAVLALISAMPTWPFDKIAERLKDHLAADSSERIRLMLEMCMKEVRKHGDEIRQLREGMTAETSQQRVEVFREVLLDGARKAESTRAKERVKRIGLILANAVVESTPTDADEIEEMMRVAMELSDRDIEFLRELSRVQGSILQSRDHIPRFEAHQSWEQGWWRSSIIPEIDSVFSKLESYGLVARIPPPNNLNISADFQNRYVLLKKGARFTILIREAAENDARGGSLNSSQKS